MSNLIVLQIITGFDQRTKARLFWVTRRDWDSYEVGLISCFGLQGGIAIGGTNVMFVLTDRGIRNRHGTTNLLKIVGHFLLY